MIFATKEQIKRRSTIETNKEMFIQFSNIKNLRFRFKKKHH